ncbi:glycosyltransferase family 9 protein [bacterium]|nr:glycosyltransferase family 9 protein [candidate division CSSED10-310 bacterium]
MNIENGKINGSSASVSVKMKTVPSRNKCEDGGPPPLVVRFGALGDMILLTPLLRALAQRHGKACEVIGKGSTIKDIYAYLPFIGETQFLVSNKTPYWMNKPKKHLVEWLKTRETDVVYMLQSDHLSQKILDKAGIIPTSTKTSVIKRPNEHVIDHMARLAGFTDEKGEVMKHYQRGTELKVSDADRTELSQWLKQINCEDFPLVLVQPGYRKYKKKLRRTWKSKHWPENRWVSLLQKIMENKPDARILITGSASEYALGNTITKSIKDNRIIPVAGQLTLRRLFALLETAHSIISVDTGTAHAAAALNCPAVVLFGKTDPRVNRPVSRKAPVTIVTGPPDAILDDFEEGWKKYHTMDAISVTQVIDAWTGTCPN